MKYHESYLSEKKALPLIIALAILLAVAACSGAPGRDDGALYDRPEPGHEEPAAGIGSGHAAGSGADGNIGDGAPDAQQPGGGDQTGSAPSEEAIVWREPKIEALVREKLAKPTGGITRSELQYFWGIELFGESHIFFNAFGGYRMPLSPDSYNAPYNPDVIDNPDNIIFHLDYNEVDPVLARDGNYSVGGIPYTRGSISSLADFANFPNLRHLHVYKNDLDDLSGLSELEHLTSLHLADNNIEDISGLTGLMQLYRIVLTGNRIEDITPLANLSKLGWLTLSCNDIHQIDAVASLSNLNTLHLDHLPAKNLDALASLRNLRWLHFSYMEIDDLSFIYDLPNPGGFWLNYLNAESIDLTPIAHHKNLGVLQIRQNKAKLLNLEALYGLDELWSLSIRPNVSLSEGDIKNLVRHLPGLVYGDYIEKEPA